jgi:hypothetical protein
VYTSPGWIRTGSEELPCSHRPQQTDSCSFPTATAADRPDLLGTTTLGGYLSVGGFTAPELVEAAHRVDALLAVERAVPPGDAGDSLYELGAILREALSEGRDLIAVYH